ncbi:MAG: tRNA (N6-threonylcarbamoyladenosine(37)-N6)-methyltransferase TrmO [Caldithrix sp.]|nr:tRNA (N6-threonylcarbamoyladenosine(37)-N6)-methyltransferase TrmO [Caldithrix sp.]
MEIALLTHHNIKLTPIGTVYSPFKKKEETPVQTIYARGVKGKIIIDPEFVDGLSDLDRFSHIFVLFYFHKAQTTDLIVIPYFEGKQRGVYATRSPSRPNHIGLSLVQLNKVDMNTIFIEDVDILDGTPVLDIKPYSPGLDNRGENDRGLLARCWQRLKKER